MIPALNLLSPEQKKEVKHSRIFFLIHEMLLFIFIATVLSAAALLSARLMLEDKFQAIILESTPGTTRIAKVNRDIHAINQQITQLQRVASGYVRWSPLLRDFSARTPKTVRWQNLQLENQKILLAGIAETRNALLEFQNNLEQSPYVKALDLPLRYLTTGENNPFMLEINLDMTSLTFPL
ncbi:PilN domain-containing protein [Candidatus Uhrbacteria bacterium]|nr:PilN domain-containing protein [Candidatus Uhrbacteria bacterium]